MNNRKFLTSWDRSIPANDQVNIGAIPDATNPAPKNPGEYMLVFKGNMGEETAAQFGIGAVVGKVVNPPILIFAATREDVVDFNLFIPENLAQKVQSNPGALSVQVGGEIIPLFPGQCFQPVPCAALVNGPSAGRLVAFEVTGNNAFAVFQSGTRIFSGNTPEDLRLIPRETLCASASSIFGTRLRVQDDFPSPLQVRFFFEGKVLFEFLMTVFPDGSVVLTNTKGVRLTDVNCRVSIQ